MSVCGVLQLYVLEKSSIAVSSNMPLKCCSLQSEVGYGAVGTNDSKIVRSVLHGKKPSKYQGNRFIRYVPQCTSSSHRVCMDKRKIAGEEGEVRHTGKE